MIKNIVQFESKVEDWISHWHLPAGIPFVAAEQMLLQYVQMIGKMKEQQAAQQATQSAPEAPPASPVDSVEPEQPKVE